MRLPLSDALAIVYGTIFDFPLTAQEARVWSIGSNKKSLIDIPIQRRLLHIRKQREQCAKGKWILAKKYAAYLRYIPSICLVGVTGGLAVNNTDKHDDIDLFIITSSHTVWTTRLLVTLLFTLCNIRRKPNQKNVKDAICLNMFLGENVMEINRHNLYIAHEILQMKPLWSRGNTYMHFLNKNRWVQNYLPNAFALPKESYGGNNIVFMIYITLFRFIDPLCYLAQRLYMQKKITHEVIEPNMALFHPTNAEIWVKEKFAKRLAKYNIPIDKIFYGL